MISVLGPTYSTTFNDRSTSLERAYTPPKRRSASSGQSEASQDETRYYSDLTYAGHRTANLHLGRSYDSAKTALFAIDFATRLIEVLAFSNDNYIRPRRHTRRGLTWKSRWSLIFPSMKTVPNFGELLSLATKTYSSSKSVGLGISSWPAMLFQKSRKSELRIE